MSRYARAPAAFTATQARQICNGQWHDTWRQIVQGERLDITTILPIRIGLLTEPLNLEWLAREKSLELLPPVEAQMTMPDGASLFDHIIERDVTVPVPESTSVVRHGLIACKADARALIGEKMAVVEAKHAGLDDNRAVTTEKYVPQVMATMWAYGVELGILSVIYSTSSWQSYLIEWSESYWQAMQEDLDDFRMLLALEREPETLPYRTATLDHGPPAINARWKVPSPKKGKKSDG